MAVTSNIIGFSAITALKIAIAVVAALIIPVTTLKATKAPVKPTTADLAISPAVPESVSKSDTNLIVSATIFTASASNLNAPAINPIAPLVPSLFDMKSPIISVTG